jgi:hypothetical protein
MTKLHQRVVVLGLIAGALASATGSGTLSATQRQSREQHAYVSVLGSNDAPIAAPPADAFAVREEGIAREVLRVTPAPPPSHLVLLVDDGQATDQLTLDLRTALKSFVTALPPAGSGPVVRLATFGDRPTTRVEFTTTSDALLRSIAGLFPRPGAGGTFLEAIVDSCKAFKTRSATRPMIVAFVAESGIEYSNETHTRVSEALQSTGASLWSVVLQDRNGQTMSEANRERSIVLGDVSRRSGGFSKTVLSKQALDSAFTTMAAAIKGQVDVAYGRPESMIPPKKIEVTLRQGGQRVIASEWARP